MESRPETLSTRHSSLPEKNLHHLAVLVYEKIQNQVFTNNKS